MKQTTQSIFKYSKYKIWTNIHIVFSIAHLASLGVLLVSFLYIFFADTLTTIPQNIKSDSEEIKQEAINTLMMLNSLIGVGVLTRIVSRIMMIVSLRKLHKELDLYSQMLYSKGNIYKELLEYHQVKSYLTLCYFIASANYFAFNYLFRISE